MTQWSVNGLDSMVSKGSMYWDMVNYGVVNCGDFSRNFRDFFHSGMASHSWGNKGSMEDWFVGHKGKVVKGRLNMVEGMW